MPGPARPAPVRYGRACARRPILPARASPGEPPSLGIPVSPRGSRSLPPGRSGSWPAASLQWLAQHPSWQRPRGSRVSVGSTDVSRETGQNFALRSASGQRARWLVGFSARACVHPVTAGGVETAHGIRIGWDCRGRRFPWPLRDTPRRRWSRGRRSSPTDRSWGLRRPARSAGPPS